jgi:hypothetical protein
MQNHSNLQDSPALTGGKLENSMINMAEAANKLLTPCTAGTMAWDLLRDLCDQQTGGDLDYLQLDLLTDSVQSRLSKPPKIKRYALNS